MEKFVKKSVLSRVAAIALFVMLSIPCWGQSPYWTGEGGKGMVLGIAEPAGQGLSVEQAYLPVMVQGVLFANITKYSAMAVIDHVSLEKIIAESFTPGASLDIARLGEAVKAGYIMTGRVSRASGNFTLQFTVTETAENKAIATYSGTCTQALLDDHTAIQKAAQELLLQMGVRLTDRAKNDLAAATSHQSIAAQTILAQGIIAQKNGAVLEPLFCYFQAAALDPTLKEAMARASTLSANVSAGNIGGDNSNDDQWKQNWEKCLEETEKYYNNYFGNLFKGEVIPYTLFFATDMRQMGATNSRDGTVTLGGLETILRVSPDWTRSTEVILRSMQTSMQAVFNGLNSTKRRGPWGLDKWPQQSTMNVEPFGKQGKSFTVTAELLNNENKVIGTQTFQTSGTYDLPLPFPGRGGQSVHISPDDKKAISFTNVNSSDVTDNLTVRIALINEEDPAIAAKSGLLQIMAIPSMAQANIYLMMESDNGIITNYNGRGGVLNIPDMVWDSPVTSIGSNAMVNKQLVNVAIPNTVTKIGDSSFLGNQLIKVSIPDSVTSIGDSALARNQLAAVTIPPKVTFIGANAFSYNRLTAIEIPTSVMSIGDGAFSNNQLTSITIPGTFTKVGDSVFAFNQLVEITIPNTITTIGQKAFADNKLVTINIPASVTTIEQEAFARNQMTELVIPDTVTKIEKDAFAGNQLASVTITKGISTIGEGIFRDNKLTSVTIPRSVTEIEKDAFARNQLAVVIIPDSVTSIGENAFAGNKLASVSIPHGVTNIGFKAFSENRLVSVEIPESVKTIGVSVFYINQLASVTLPSTLTTIGGWAFSGNRLTTLTIPEGVTSIGESAFSWNQLTSITIPSSVKNLGGAAFGNNPLVSITIGENVVMKPNTFDNNFEKVYNKNGKKAGVYILEKKKWKYLQL